MKREENKTNRERGKKESKEGRMDKGRQVRWKTKGEKQIERMNETRKKEKG